MADKLTQNTEVSIAEIAGALGITARYVRQLTEDGTLTRTGRGKYPLFENVQNYIRYKSQGDLDEEEAALDKRKLAAEVRLKNAKAKMAQMEAQELEGKMHRSEDVAAMTEDLIFEIRGALMALPGRLAVDVSACGSAAEAADVIRREVNLVMGELAGYQYDPQKYSERVRERMKWDTEALDNEE